MLKALGLVVTALLLVSACGGGDDTDLSVIDDEREVESGDVDAPEIEGDDDTTDDDDGDDDEAAALETTDDTVTVAPVEGDDDEDTDEGDTPVEAGPPAPEDGAVDELDEDEANDGATVGRTGLDEPEAVVIDLATGDEVELAGGLAGQGTTVLWFWENGSAESAAEAATIASLADDFDGRLTVVAVGTGGDAEQAERFRQDAGLTGVTTVWDPAAESLEYYQVSAIPSVIAVNDAGDIMGRWSTLTPEVAQFLDLIA